MVSGNLQPLIERPSVRLGRRDAALVALGQTIRDARQRAGLSQEQFAEAAGLSRRQIIRLEQGESRPLLSTLAKLAAVTSDGSVCFETLRRTFGETLAA